MNEGYCQCVHPPIGGGPARDTSFGGRGPQRVQSRSCATSPSLSGLPESGRL